MAEAHSQTQDSTTMLKKIVGVRLPKTPSSELWDITIEDGKISSVDAHDSSIDVSASNVLNGNNKLIAPSLVHAHVHLDKAFLLQDPKYSDLQIESGDFKEAMEMTGKAKSRFDEEDLLKRGGQLIEESMMHGVTAMRAFVEVDGVVQLKCLHAGLKLKAMYSDRCYIQICAFAQLPLFSGENDGVAVQQLMTTAAGYPDVEVIGSTPYVEDDEAKSKKNVHWITQLALREKKHLDFHLDYFLEEDKQPLVWYVVETLKRLEWPAKGGKQVAFGHCTRLTRFKEEEWQRLAKDIGKLPVSFVGLPTSDLFMMRTSEGLRGTLPVLQLIEQYGLNAAISINNVGNAFTPQGNCDPLGLAQLAVGVYQAGTKQDAERIYVRIRPTKLFSETLLTRACRRPSRLVQKPSLDATQLIWI
jgi:cytosine/adenosine deaminase-related metal-dependent hydrolase